MKFVFGKDFALQFRPCDDEGKALVVSTDAPSIRVYKDRPTYQQAADGTGTNQQGSEIVSWNTTADGNGKIINIPAIDDPDPEQNPQLWSYYVAVNFTLTASEQTQTRIIEIWLSRAGAHTDTVLTTNQDIKNAYPAISAYLSNDQIDRFITSAIEEIRLRLKASGVKWSRIQSLRDFNTVVAYRTIELCAIGNFRQAGDKWDKLMGKYGPMFTESFKLVQILYDADGDGTVDKQITRRSYIVASA